MNMRKAAKDGLLENNKLFWGVHLCTTKIRQRRYTAR